VGGQIVSAVRQWKMPIEGEGEFEDREGILKKVPPGIEGGGRRTVATKERGCLEGYTLP